MLLAAQTCSGPVPLTYKPVKIGVTSKLPTNARSRTSAVPFQRHRDPLLPPLRMPESHTFVGLLPCTAMSSSLRPVESVDQVVPFHRAMRPAVPTAHTSFGAAAC